MPAANAFEIATFRANNPDVVAYLENNPTDTWALAFTTDGVLPDSICTGIRDQIDGDRFSFPDAPAEEWHAAWIPNGDYSVTTEADRPAFVQVHEYRIHLVNRGPLAGKRIVKVRRNGSNLYSGFGFLTRGGTFQLWTRFAAEANDPHVAGARALFDAFSIYSTEPASRRHANEIVADWGTGSIIRYDATTSRGRFPISYRVRTLRCLHCNNVARDFLRPFPLCTDHSLIPARPAQRREDVERAPDPEFQLLIDEEAQIEQGNVGRQASIHRRRRTARAASQSARTLPMSQVTGKYVQ